MRTIAVRLLDGEIILSTDPKAPGKYLGRVTPRPDLGGFKAYDDDETGIGTFPTLEDAATRVSSFALTHAGLASLADAYGGSGFADEY